MSKSSCETGAVHICDLGKQVTTPLGDHSGQDRGHAESLSGLSQTHSVVDHHLRLVAIQVRKLVRLVVD
jgi:hypothetical protein